jgi:anti-anti-sigma factor
MAKPDRDTERTSATIEQVGDENGTLVFRVFGEIDIASVGELEERMAPILRAPPRRIAFDLSKLTFMDSSGIAFFLMIADKIDEMEMRRPTEIVRRIIEVTGLSTTFHVVP